MRNRPGCEKVTVRSCSPVHRLSGAANRPAPSEEPEFPAIETVDQRMPPDGHGLRPLPLGGLFRNQCGNSGGGVAWVFLRYDVQIERFAFRDQLLQQFQPVRLGSGAGPFHDLPGPAAGAGGKNPPPPLLRHFRVSQCGCYAPMKSCWVAIIYPISLYSSDP